MKTRLQTSLTALVSLTILFTACSGGKKETPPPPPIYYSLTVNMGVGVSGSPSQATNSYQQGTVVNYTYTVSTGYKDLSVKLDGSVVSNSGKITMNSNHTVEASAVLMISPAITSMSENQYLNPGDRATFSVVATGDDLKYQWNRDGVAIPNATNTSYLIDSVSLNDTGAAFTVTVSNVSGSVTSSRAFLAVVPSVIPVGTVPVVKNISAVINETGGSLTLPSIGAITIPAGALAGSQTITLSVDSDPNVLTYMNNAVQVYDVKYRTDYVIKLNVGTVIPSGDISLVLKIPDEIKQSLTPGYKVSAFGFTPPGFGDDIIDGLDPIGSQIDLSNNTVTMIFPNTAYYQYSAPGKTYHFVCFLAVIPGENTTIRQSRTGTELVGLCDSGYCIPAIQQSPLGANANTEIISVHGERHIDNSDASKNHPGVDITAIDGTPVYSSGPGIVVNPHDATGENLKYVVVQHDNDPTDPKKKGSSYTRYLHLSTIKVVMNQKIDMNTIIGESGHSGHVPAHLHFELRSDESPYPSGDERIFKFSINPLPFLPAYKINYAKAMFYYGLEFDQPPASTINFAYASGDWVTKKDDSATAIPLPAIKVGDSVDIVPIGLNSGLTPVCLSQDKGATVIWTVDGILGPFVNQYVDVNLDPSTNVIHITGKQGTTTPVLIKAKLLGYERTLKVTVNSAPVSITSFEAVPSTISLGGSSYLKPVFANATSASITGVGNVFSGGSCPVKPSTNTSYTLTVEGVDGPLTKTIVVNVVDKTPKYVQQGPKLVASPTNWYSYQGSAVSISGDGNTAVVGGRCGDGIANDTGGGAGWVWTRSGGVWTQQVKLVGTGSVGQSSQGESAAISADGKTIILGGPLDDGATADHGGIGAAWVWMLIDGVWVQQAKFVGSDHVDFSCQGTSVSLSSDGNTAIVEGYDNSAAGWIWRRKAGVWTQQAKLVNAESGNSVSLSADGNTALIGAWVWKCDNNGVWTQQAKLMSGTSLGYSGSIISADGNTAVIGIGSGPGGVDIWVKKQESWEQQAFGLVGSGWAGEFCGQGDGYSSISISSNGNIVLVGGPYDNTYQGATWVWERTGEVWTQRGNKLLGSGLEPRQNAYQGTSVSLSADGNTAIIGGPNANTESGWGTGAVWIFTAIK